MLAERRIDAAHLGLPGSRRFVVWGQVPTQVERGERVLSVVGSRAALRRLCDRTADVVQAAGRLGCAVVSGGALGIDGAAHRAALAHGVPQLLVHPCGPDHLYPEAHVDLIHAVARAPDSAVLFAVPEGTPPTRGLFASRNAIVVGLSRAIVVVQAGLRSGTMNSARLARREGIGVGTFDASPGGRALLGAGAQLLPAEGSLDADLQRLLGGGPGDEHEEVSDPLLARLETPMGLDELCTAFPDLGLVGLMGRLAALRASGAVVEVSPGCYVRSPRAG